MKQIFKNILTKIFGYKNYVVSYKVFYSYGVKEGNAEFRVKRLCNLTLKFVKEYLSKSHNVNQDKIMLSNVFRIHF